MNVATIKPYLIRAVYEWCIDNGLTPYLTALADACSNVPAELAKNGEITLSISNSATRDLLIGNTVIQFTARFNGVPRKIEITVASIKAVFAKELGHGLTFIPEIIAEANDIADNRSQHSDDTQALSDEPITMGENKQGKSFLKIVK